jgi:hypothetical protein
LTQQQDTDPSAFDCVLRNILGFMLPFFLLAAGGNPDLARAAIKELINPTRPAHRNSLTWSAGLSASALRLWTICGCR